MLRIHWERETFTPVRTQLRDLGNLWNLVAITLVVRKMSFSFVVLIKTRATCLTRRNYSIQEMLAGKKKKIHLHMNHAVNSPCVCVCACVSEYFWPEFLFVKEWRIGKRWQHKNAVVAAAAAAADGDVKKTESHREAACPRTLPPQCHLNYHTLATRCKMEEGEVVLILAAGEIE